MIGSFFHEIDLSSIDPGFVGWRPHQQFLDATPSVASMGCHYSVLSEGQSPHPPHAHVEEELLIILDGEAELLIGGGTSDPSPRTEVASRGKFAYYPAWQHHTIRNNSNRPVTYIMFKWADPRAPAAALDPDPHRDQSNSQRMETGVFDLRSQLERPHEAGLWSAVVFEGKTAAFGKLHCHLTKLGPGAGYLAHADPYDVAIVLLAGSIAINGQELRKSGVAYFGAGVPHDMLNPGASAATYLVFEFHQ